MRRDWILLLAAASAATTVTAAADAPRGEQTAVNIEETTAEAARTPEEPFIPIDRTLYKWLQKTKKEMRERYGLEWALEYTAIYQATSGGYEVRDAAVGTLGLNAIWRIFRDDNGIDSAGVGLQLETRANYTDDQFTEMTEELGTLWAPNDSTSNSYDKINQLWWGQKFDRGRFTYLVGKIDPGAHINGNRFAGSGNTQFFSQPFATNPARAFPDNGLGVMARIAPVEWFYLHGVVSDSSADSSYSPFKTLDGNWFGAVEAGLKPRFESLGEGVYRLLLWQRETDDAHGTGFSLSFDQNLGPHFGAFCRYGVNDGDMNAIEHIAAAGISLLDPFGRGSDQAGIGVSWTRPADHDLRDEFSAEVYYRLQLTEGIELSASAQLIEQPAASDRDEVAVFGLRLRLLY